MKYAKRTPKETLLQRREILLLFIWSLAFVIYNLKEDHEEQMVEAGKDYEDRVAYLLKQMTSRSQVGEVKEEDIKKFSKLKENLMRMTQDFDTKKKKSVQLFQLAFQLPFSTKETRYSRSTRP